MDTCFFVAFVGQRLNPGALGTTAIKVMMMCMCVFFTFTGVGTFWKTWKLG